MKRIGLSVAKNGLPELVERAAQGEEIGITRHGKLAALIVPVRAEISLEEVFQDIERIRKKAKLPKAVTVDDLIEDGRR